MRLYAWAIFACVSTGILVAGVAMAMAAEGTTPPKRGIFSFRARPLEPTPAGEPTSARARPSAAARSTPQQPTPAHPRASATAPQRGGVWSDAGSQAVPAVTETTGTPVGAAPGVNRVGDAASVSQRMRIIQEANRDPELEDAAVETVPGTLVSPPAGTELTEEAPAVVEDQTATRTAGTARAARGVAAHTESAGHDRSGQHGSRPAAGAFHGG